MGHEKRRAMMSESQSSVAKSFEGKPHTMTLENFRRYIGRHGVPDKQNNIDEKKFTGKQIALLQMAYGNHTPVRVVGIYDRDLIAYAKEKKLALVGQPEAHTRDKRSNKHRPLFASVRGRKNGNPELWVVVFPSRQYVDQVAELIQALFDDFKRHHVEAKDPHKGHQVIKVEHFPTLEQNVADWTDFQRGAAEYVRSGDVVAIGQVELLEDGLADIGFAKKFGDWKPFGIDGMFCVQIYVHTTSLSRIVLIGVHHCFWGEASAHYARACAAIGAGHLLYASKAGTFTEDKLIGQVHTPTDFLLCEGYDHDTHVEPLSSRVKLESDLQRLAASHGILVTGFAVTVPTVVSETMEQREKLSKWSVSTIDNEDAHIAKQLETYHAPLNGIARFVPVHFISDYIHRANEKPADGEHGLATTRPEIRDAQFRNIGRFFANYTLIHGLRDYVRLSAATVSARKSIGIHDVEKILQTRQHLLDNGLIREALASMVGLNGKSELDGAMLSAVALSCQKYGFVEDASFALNLWEESAPKGETENTYRMRAIRVKLLSQCARFEDVLHAADRDFLFGAAPSPEREPFLSAIYFRMAIACANLGRIDEMKSHLAKARDRADAQDSHAIATFNSFTSICALASGDQETHIQSLSVLLSDARGLYLSAATTHSVWRVNPEKSFLSALFSESALYLVYGSENDSRGWVRLIAAHLFNIRVGGTERSEGFAELIYSIHDVRVKELLRLAMRMDGPGRVEFQRIANVSNRMENVQRCLAIQKLPLPERNQRLNEIFDTLLS